MVPKKLMVLTMLLLLLLMFVFQILSIAFLRSEAAALKRQRKFCEQESHSTVANLKSSDFLDKKIFEQKRHLCNIKLMHKSKGEERKNNKVHSFFLIIIIQVLNTVSFLLLVGTMTVTQPSGILSGERKECFGIPAQLPSSHLLLITCTSSHFLSCAFFKYDEFR